MKKWILATALVQIAFFALWGFSESRKLSQGLSEHGEFLLETYPVDPRDLLSGQYMALRLKISDASKWLPVDSRDLSGCAVLIKAKSVVTVNQRPYQVYSSIGAERPAPEELPAALPGQIWVRAQSGPNARLVFGIERYYFGEDRKDEMNRMRGGQFYARVTAAPDGTLKLLGLERK